MASTTIASPHRSQGYAHPPPHSLPPRSPLSDSPPSDSPPPHSPPPHSPPPCSPPPERGAARRTQPAAPSAVSDEPVAERTGASEAPPTTPVLQRLRGLVTRCRRKKKTQREECKELFDQIDEDASGLLDVSEIIKLANMLGVQMSAEQAQIEINKMDDDGSGEVDFEEFYMWFKQADDDQKSNYSNSKLGKASIRWAEHEQHRAVVLASAQRNTSVLSRAIAGQRTVEEMRALHGLAREKEG